MNRKDKQNRSQNSTMHTSSFLVVHPPGGLVAWPDGRTSRIGERRQTKLLAGSSNAERTGFVAWPVCEREALRA